MTVLRANREKGHLATGHTLPLTSLRVDNEVQGTPVRDRLHGAFYVPVLNFYDLKIKQELSAVAIF